MITTYIAGPISGNVKANKLAFFSAEEELAATGRVVLHSAGLPVGLTEPQYMDICYAMIRACSEIVMLPGWRKSAGATAEYYYAKKIGLKIVFVPTGIDIAYGMSLVF
ncbi:DUF4406 domain-containing protein [Shewanella sp. NKUCC01_JLK]|uniref:DUF4406 domain-containing protein n=1 Tax=Shewanella sp. NKUCC01_JLK TaxID=2842123 RepID=UPI001C5AFCF6|nr:DUF4406 domain-containing protein [Shewanella sp. NKUCC01_JLK]MBW3514953.1 DUF4406 domain-containing protein [Shewanella sp. NKUCC01_JLK]